MEILIRPSYIYSPKSYNARLDSACARGVKSARFEAPWASTDRARDLLIIECFDLIRDVDVVAYHVIERIASVTLECCVVAMID